MRRVLVVGDCISDVYTTCSFKKNCPDAPDVRALVRRDRDVRPGGAANVAVNLAAILEHDVAVDLIGVLDAELARSIRHAADGLVSLDRCYLDEPLVKERFFDDDTMVLRVDNRAVLPSFINLTIVDKLRSYLSRYEPELIIMSDYGSGTVGDETLSVLLHHRDRLLVDTKKTDLSIFGDPPTLMIKLNREEWAAAVANDAYPERHFMFMIVTMGKLGAEVVMKRDNTTNSIMLKSFDVPAVDVCGCGDTFMAGFAAAFLRDRDPFTAAEYANAAAASVVVQRRTAVVDCDMIQRLLERT